MVTDAQRRAAQAVRQAVACVGQLAVLSGSRLRLLDPRACGGADAQEDPADALWDGVGAGLRLLIDSGLERAGELRRELSGQRPQSEAAQQLSAKAEALVGCLEAVLAAWKAVSAGSAASLCTVCVSSSPRVPAGTWCQFRPFAGDPTLAPARTGRRCDGGALRTCVERICVLGGLGADSCAQSPGDLASAGQVPPPLLRGRRQTCLVGTLGTASSEQQRGPPASRGEQDRPRRGERRPRARLRAALPAPAELRGGRARGNPVGVKAVERAGRAVCFRGRRQEAGHWRTDLRGITSAAGEALGSRVRRALTDTLEPRQQAEPRSGSCRLEPSCGVDAGTRPLAPLARSETVLLLTDGTRRPAPCCPRGARARSGAKLRRGLTCG
ncbi:hypothetical protein QTO34_012375 [Cnephaeus nilssonii]|uniref:KIF14 four-helical bundle domain-containing protein n=1 Tax=Cnephaeus nilssonii TaxID=3371016 RepID=A0AA40HBD6_CNENI|nr:hypothetical protein QTO34_012375 [Eptesicus nilssonii]